MNLKRFLGLHPKYPVHIFHHIPKCGGTAFRRALKTWFKIVGDYMPWAEDQRAEFFSNPQKLGKLNNGHILCGHFEYEENHLYNRYPEAWKREDQYKILTIVRDPLQLRQSLYNYEWQKKVRSEKDGTLTDDLLKRSNYMASVMGITKENADIVLDRYDFIGIQEHLQYSLDQLATKINRRKVKLDKVNVTKSKIDLEVPESILEEFRHQNTLDYKIYNYAREKFGENGLS